MQKKPTSAYVHIPFCTQICYYCDFSKVFIKNQPVDSYLEHLLQEFHSYDIQKLRTLYIGGGTPTALSAPQLELLLDGLTKNLDLSVLEELTIEANPGDLDADKIAVLKNSAVNRVSLGVQTFDDKMLKKIGRSHLEKDIYENIDRLKLAGFDNISIDLIYALPGQTMDQVKENVAKAIALDIPHMSLYSLILENHTVFMNRMRRGKLPLPKEELEAEMFEYIISKLEKAGFEHYEISNFSKPGFESRHNLMYWDNAEYYGIGAGASGYVNGVRYKNHGPIRHYLSFQFLLRQRQFPSSHTIHKDRVIFQYQAIETHVGNIQPNGLNHIVLNLLHSLTRQCINQVNRDIVKTSQLQAVDIFINILLQMTAPNLFQHLVIKCLHA